MSKDPFYQKGGLTSMMNKVDFSKPCYLILSRKPPTCLIDPETGQPWHTYFKPLAERMAFDIEKTDKVKVEVVDFITALRFLCEQEGLRLKPPYSFKNVTDQLMSFAAKN